MDGYLAKPFSREALHITLARWLVKENSEAALPSDDTQTALSDDDATVELPVPAGLAADPVVPTAPDAAELLLDRATLDALRALPRSGPKDMLSHIGEIYLSDSSRLVDSIEHALQAGEAIHLARAAHAWRSYNGNVGAHSLASLCRELESHARAADLAAARETFARIQILHGRVRDELQHEMRRSA
jgi:HPt (histidine-containing phosphotransfer) domain-containing protein